MRNLIILLLVVTVSAAFITVQGITQDADKMELLLEEELDGEGEILFSPDGKRLTYFTRYPNTLKVWDCSIFVFRF